MYFLLLRRSSRRTDVCPGLLRPPAFQRLDLSIHDARRQNSAGAVTRTRISTTTKANFSTMVQAGAPGIAALASAVRLSGFLESGFSAYEEVQKFPDSTFPDGGFRQRKMGLDLVFVAPAVLVLDDVAGLGEVADDAIGRSEEHTSELQSLRHLV